MDFDRIQAKWDARASVAVAKPHPMIVTLLFQVLAVLIPLAIFMVAMVLPMIAGRGAWLYSRAIILVLLFLNILMAFYMAAASAGYVRYGMHLARGEATAYGDLLDGFGRVGVVIRTFLLMMGKILLWEALAFIPMMLLTWLVWYFGNEPQMLPVLIGIYVVLMVAFGVYMVWVMLRYALAYFFLMDEPESGARAAIRNSVDYMRGWKWTFFKMELSFLGWQILSGMTFGILGLWVTPYAMATYVNFYDFITGRRGQNRSMSY